MATNEKEQDIYFRANVDSLDSELDGAGVQIVQSLKATVTTGDREGEEIEFFHVIPQTQVESRGYEEGDEVIVLETADYEGVPQFFALDHYRLPALGAVVIVFFVLALVFARKKGALAIIGLLVSLAILGGFIVPQLAQGADALLIGVIGIGVIAPVSFYIAHGFNKRTSIALLGTGITLVIAAFAAIAFVSVTNLFGIGSDEAAGLQVLFGETIEFRNLLLVGMLIGALGVLDDITTSLVATVGEIHKANPKLSSKELYKRGSVVGREHIASLINTLVLAYAGAAMPVLLLFTFDFQPLWVSLNSQFLAEEIVRTIVGSSALVLAVPITTKLAAKFVVRNKKKATK